MHFIEFIFCDNIGTKNLDGGILTQPSDEQLDLIKACIVQHPNYDPKKCRMSELVNLVWEKSSMFIDSIANENTVKKYIMKIVGENLEECNLASDIAQIQEAQENFIKETATKAPVVAAVPEVSVASTVADAPAAPIVVPEPPKIIPEPPPPVVVSKPIAVSEPPRKEPAPVVTPVQVIAPEPPSPPPAPPQEEIIPDPPSKPPGPLAPSVPDPPQEELVILSDEDPIEFNEVDPPPASEEQMSAFYKLEQALGEVISKSDKLQDPQIGVEIDDFPFEEVPVTELSRMQQINELPQISIDEPQQAQIEEPSMAQVEQLPEILPQAPVSPTPPQVQPPRPAPPPSPPVRPIPSEPQENAYEHVDDPLESTKSKKVSKELTEKVVDIVRFAHSKDPTKNYFRIFYLKYVQKMKQSEIALELDLTEEELCDRYLKLVRIVKHGLSQNSANN